MSQLSKRKFIYDRSPDRDPQEFRQPIVGNDEEIGVPDQGD
jgi:hypothetical protein